MPRITAKDVSQIQGIVSLTYHNGESLIDARGLHEWLEVQSEFSHWIQRRLDKLGFEKDLDYFSSDLAKSTGGRPPKEYLLTIETAKHVATSEETEKGFQLRQYLFWCEKQLGRVIQSGYDGQILNCSFVKTQRQKNLRRIQEVGLGDNVVQSFQRSNQLLSGMTGIEIRQWAKQNGVPEYLTRHSLQDAWRYDSESYYLSVGTSLYSDLIIAGLSHIQVDDVVKQVIPSLKIIGSAIGHSHCLKESKRKMKSVESKKIEQLELF